MPKRQITLTCQIDEALAHQLEETNLLSNPDLLAEQIVKSQASKEQVLASYLNSLQTEAAQYLAPMDGYLALLATTGSLSESQQKFLQTVQQNNHQLKLLLSRFALAFKIHYGSFCIAACDQEDLDFAELVAAAWKTLKHWHPCAEVTTYFEQNTASVRGVTHLLYESLLQIGELIYRWEPQQIDIDLETDAQTLNLYIHTDALLTFTEADFVDFPTFSTFEVYNTYHILKAHGGDLKITSCGGEQPSSQIQITLPLLVE
jgi:hypothetical protein